MLDHGTEPVRLGVLGCADVADRRVLPAVASTGCCRVVAVASRESGRAGDFAARHGADAVTGYDALLAREDVEAVYLPLPPALHAEWIGRALLAGKHVLSEKPLTLSAADTGRAVELAAARGLVLRENFMFCHHTMHDAVRRVVGSGAVGELRSFSATFAIPHRTAHDIRYRRELGGGALNDVAGYPLRAALMFLGPDLTVRGAALRGGPGPADVDMGGAALLSRPDGVTATIGFGLSDGYRSAYRLAGSEGRVEVEHVFTTPASHEPVLTLTTTAGTERTALDAHDQFRSSVEAFAAAVRGRPGPPAWDPSVTVRQARLLDDIRRAAATGGGA